MPEPSDVTQETQKLAGDLAGVSPAQALALAAQALAALVKALAPGSSVSAPDSPLSIISHLEGVSFTSAAAQFLQAKARAGVSDRYLAQLRYTLEKFGRGRARRPLASISTQEIEAWLASQGWKPKTWKGQVANLRSLFLWSKKRGLAQHDPAGAVDLPRPDPCPPCLHTPDQVKRVLQTALAISHDTCRVLAIRYFAGIRTAESERLEEKDIHLEAGHIEISAAKAKTRARRLIPISQNLRAWLALGGQMPGDQEKRVGKVVKLAGVPWPKNVTRHSFVSYHLALHQRAGETSLAAGHTEQMLFANYREIVTQAAAEAYFAIVP